MAIQLKEDAKRFESGLKKINEQIAQINFADEISVIWKQAQGLKICYENKKAEIHCMTAAAFFRAIGHLCEQVAGGKNRFVIKEDACFQHLGASLDVSRNSVLKIERLKKILCQLALMGFDELYLYTEDTYELEQYPLFGYLRGKYSKAELKELDAYALDLGIELIPCIQTLGHLERFLHWETNLHLRDTPDVLLVGSEETYQLIDAMLAACAECYHSKKIHIGMDEAMNLGLGRYLQKNGFQNSFEIMQTHIQKVNELAKKYGFQPMMWSDMYFRCASPNNDYYEDNIEIPQQVIESAPNDIGLVYWDYYHTEQSFYHRYIRLHQKFKAPLSFAGGMWTWLGAAIDYDEFFKKSIPALQACVENKVENIILTTWGDDGAETSVRTMLLGFLTYAEFCYTKKFDKSALFLRLKNLFGADGELLCKIAQFNKTSFLPKNSDLPNGAKFLLYQDPLLGIYDADIKEMGFAEQYAKLEAVFANACETSDKEWLPVYRFYKQLASVLKDKSELGVQMQQAYRNQQKENLLALAQQAKRASDNTWILLDAWKSLWMLDCKPFGFEVLEVRIAGVASRLNSTAKRLQDYCSGTIDRLEELEETRLNLLKNPKDNSLHGVYFWKEIVSASRAF